MVDTLTLSLEDRTVVTIFIGKAQYTGPVVKLPSDAGTIVDLDQFGQRDGEFAFRIEDIDAVDFGSEHERRVQFLSRCGAGDTGLTPIRRRSTGCLVSERGDPPIDGHNGRPPSLVLT